MLRGACWLALLLLACGAPRAANRPLVTSSLPPTVPSSSSSFEGEERPGGATTVDDHSATALGRVVKNLSSVPWEELLEGKRLFRRDWSKPASTDQRSALGPLYNGTSCTHCHFLDGRGGPPQQQQPDVSLLAKLALAGGGALRPEPTYGTQLSEQATEGLQAEGSLRVDYEVRSEHLPGAVVELRRPHYSLEDLKWGAPHENLALSPRMPGSLAGLGLLEAIAVTDVVRAADPEDRDGDGISGRPNWVAEKGSATPVLGRFGWKASQPSVMSQIATALREDMGLTSWLRPESQCTQAQPACTLLDGQQEVSRLQLERLTNYVTLLAVPSRRTPDAPAVQHGRQLFLSIGCGGCHTPRQVTRAADVRPELAGQVIFPYTDLLLHDMGAELADDVAEEQADGAEWRTPPLWGLGLLTQLHGRLRLLHDGRARSVEEAILWHGGEAQSAVSAYRALTLQQRSELSLFVESL